MNSEYTIQEVQKICEANDWRIRRRKTSDIGNLEVKSRTSGNIVGLFTPIGWRWKDKYKFVLYNFDGDDVLPEVEEPDPIINVEPSPIVEAEPSPVVEAEPAPNEEGQ